MIEDADETEDEDYIDFWTDINETEDVVIDLSEAYLPQIAHWDNKAQSYKCGRSTAIKFCTSQEYEYCDTFPNSQSAAGYGESKDIEIDLSLTVITLTPYNPDVRIAATVYENTSCQGYSSVIWIEEGKIGTRNTYHNIHESLVTTPANPQIGIASVLFPPGENYFLHTWKNTWFDGAE